VNVEFVEIWTRYVSPEIERVHLTVTCVGKPVTPFAGDSSVGVVGVTAALAVATPGISRPTINRIAIATALRCLFIKSTP
jgi:hypothetical protein